MTDDLIEAFKYSSKLMPFLHLPVQSGSSKILKLMNRKHTVNYYYDIINKLKKANPSMKFSSDFIIGYPGETKEDFNETIRLMSKIKFINTYSFIFSPRPGTPASKLKSVDKNQALIRLQEFQKLSEKIKYNYKNELLGKTVRVLIENRLKNQNKYFGKDEFSNSVIIESTRDLTGLEIDIKVSKINTNTLFGKYDKKKDEYEAA